MAQTIDVGKDMGTDEATQNGTVGKKRRIWDLILERARNHSEAELAKIPHDGALNHDHYLYGCPKKTDNE